ncbi:hypothetical protein BDW68DRAFT_190136 [Aspergillus falconensis]
MRGLQVYLVAGLAMGNLSLQCETASIPDPGTGEKILRVSSPDQLAVFEESCAPADNLGLVEIPDLLDVGKIWPLLLSAMCICQKLQWAGSIDFVQVSPSGELDLGSLVEADNDCGIHLDDEFAYLNVDLPSFKKANRFEVAGTIKRFVNCALLTWDETNYPVPGVQDLRVNIQEGEYSLGFEAPKLNTLNGLLEVYGAASGKHHVGATFIASSPLSIYSTIKTAEYLYVWGELYITNKTWTSIDLPSLTDLGTVDLAYEPRIPCNENPLQTISNGETSSEDTVDDATNNLSTGDRGTNSENNPTAVGDSNNDAKEGTPDTGSQDISGFNANNATGENSAGSLQMISIYCTGLMLTMATSSRIPAFL